MPLKVTLNLRQSVGHKGVNSTNDVRAVQTQLNDLLSPPRAMLRETGTCDAATVVMIRDFQAAVLRQTPPSGLISPGDRTMAALNAPGSRDIWARAPLFTGGPGDGMTSGLTGEALVCAIAVEEGEEEFERWIRAPQPGDITMDAGIKAMKFLLNSVSTADTARQLIHAWKFLRGIGLQPQMAMKVLSALALTPVVASDRATVGTALRMASQFKMVDPPRFWRWIGVFAKPGSRFGSALAGLAKVGAAAAVFVTLFEAVEMARKGDYAAIVPELYKLAMGTALPWAAAIDAVQSILDAVLPPSATSMAVFKVLRACDPLGLGAIGIESVIVGLMSIVDMITKGQIDSARLDRLVARMKQGPTAFFADFGEYLGDRTFDLVQWVKTL